MWHCVIKNRVVLYHKKHPTLHLWRQLHQSLPSGHLPIPTTSAQLVKICLTCPKFSLHLCPGLFNKDLYKLQITLAFLIGIFWSSGFNIPPKRSSRSKSLVPACGRNSGKQWHVWCIYIPRPIWLTKKLSVTGGSRSQKKIEVMK